METVLKAIADWIKGILTAGIMSNLSGLFDDVNTQVGNIAQQEMCIRDSRSAHHNHRPHQSGLHPTGYCCTVHAFH